MAAQKDVMKITFLKSLNRFQKSERSLFWILFIALAVVRIWLAAGIPNIFINAPYDDLYFAKMAHYLIHGQWMGPYSELTLIKGPFYAFFLIYSFITGLPLFLNETIFYVAACVLLFFAISPLIKNKWWRLLLFAILAYLPASLATPWNLRAYREFVYIGLSLFVIACAIGLFLRIGEKLGRLILWALGLGLSMGAFMICREEGPWIYPSLFFLLIVCLIGIWVGKTDHKIQRSLIVLLPILLWYIPLWIISSVNYSHYGYRGISENTDRDFNRVINTIGRIKTNSGYPYNSITYESFQKAYRASPSLAKLEDSINTIWDGWLEASYAMQGRGASWYREKYLLEEPKTINSHVLFMLRDAMQRAGYFSHGRYPAEYIRKMADELETACNNETLDCTPGLNLPYVGSISREQIPIILRLFWTNTINLAHYDINNIISWKIDYWMVDEPIYGYFAEFAYNPLEPVFTDNPNTTAFVVGERTDLRVKTIVKKLSIMDKMVDGYRALTIPAFEVLLSGWLILLVLMLVTKKKINSYHAIITFLFVLSLVIARLMTLAIISANNGVYMVSYSNSAETFLMILFFLMLYHLINQTAQLIHSRKMRPDSNL